MELWIIQSFFVAPWSYQGANISVEKKTLEAPQISLISVEIEVSKAIFSQLVVLKVSPLLHCRAEKIRSTCENTTIGQVRRPCPRRCVLSVPTSVAWKQLGVPEIVYGRVSVVWVVFPVGAAVCGCGGNCLSVQLQVHQLVARAWSVCGVAAAALSANQAQNEREEAHTWRQRLKVTLLL